MSFEVLTLLDSHAKRMASLLIIDGHQPSLDLLSGALAQPELEILTASELSEGLDLFCDRHPDIVLADVGMPSMTGVDLLERIMEIHPATDVVFMTAHYSAETAAKAVKNGASDYLRKPVPIEIVQERITKLLLAAARKRQWKFEIEDQLRTHPHFEGIIGRSPQMRDLFSYMRRIAPHYRAALITGETGTGKDLVARAIHNLSPVSSGRYVVVNCSAVVETLFESELFGHVKGSFTGATQDKTGLFEHAHQGTLFLDEIGDMPLGAQAKLLRVLQNQEVQRVGSLVAHQVNVRIIAATNHDLRAAIAAKRFREDLYYRLSMVELHAPRLADRKEDLPLLQRHFITHFAALYGKEIRDLTTRAQMRLAQHSWPGNVRELENVIGYAAMMTLNDMIDVPDLHVYLRSPAELKAQTLVMQPVEEDDDLAVHERSLVMRALKLADGNQTKAAGILRISRDRLRYKIKKHRLGKHSSGQASIAAIC